MKNKAQNKLIWASLYVIALLVSTMPTASSALAEDESSGAQAESTEAAAPQANASNPSAAESEPAAPSEGAASAQAAPSQPAVIKPWTLNTDPIFKGPLIKKFLTPADLTGRDRQILENLDYKPAGTRLRLDQIKKLTDELGKAPLRSEAALNATLGMLRLYEEQGMVFEWMRVVGSTDPKYPDLNQTLKNIRRQQAKRYQALILNYPKHPNNKQWRFKLVIARLKLGDPSVRDEAITLLKTVQGAEQHELAAVGLTLDAAQNRLPSPFGTIEQVMQSSTDQYEGAAFKLMLAEQEIAKNKPTTAIPLLQDVIATCKNIRKGDKEQTPGTILQAAATNLIAVGIQNTQSINQEIFQTLVNNDLVDYARAYLEEFALKSYTKNLPLALKAYGDALAAGQINETLKTRVEARMLDLTIASNDPRMIQIAWERAISRGIQRQINLDSQMLHSMNVVMSQFRVKPDKDLALRIASMHDSFVRGFPAYAAREDYDLRMIDMLNQTQQFNEVGRRTELAISKFKSRPNIITALQYNLRARSHAMGLGSEIRIASGQKIIGEPAFAIGYVGNADKLRNMLPKGEGDHLYYLSAFVQLLGNNRQAALTRYEEAFTRAPRHPLAGDSASVFLENLMQRKETVEVEKFVRLMIKSGVVPSREPYRSLMKILEQVVFENSKQLFDRQQYEQAAVRFVGFQKEFPLSPNAPVALERAAVGFGLAKKTEFSMQAYDLYLKTYPKLPQAKEIRWSAAELARNSKAFLKAAEHYQTYGQLYPQDALTRRVFLRAGESFRDGNKLPEAISELERHLRLLKSPDEQKNTLLLIAELAQKANNSMSALSAFERLSKIVKVPDEVISVNFNLLTVYQKLGRDEQAKKAAAAAIAIRPATPDGFKMQAKARYLSGRFEINGLRARQIMNMKDLKIAMQSLSKDYERVKANLLAPCEIPGVDWCALGYYELSKLAGDLAKLLAVVEPQSHLEENLVAELKSMILFARDKYKTEAKSFALQAEDALASSGIPDQDTADKIKIYVQQVKQARDEEQPAATEGGSSSGGGGGGGEQDF